MIQYFIFKNLPLVLDKPGGACKFSKTNMTFAFQG